MGARVLEGKVLIDDPAEASRIHNRGGHGTPQSGGGVLLELEEAAYLVECGRLPAGDGEPLDLPSLLELGSRLDPAFDIRFLVYRDLRGRGYVVKRFSETLYKVFERGEGKKDHTANHILLRGPPWVSDGSLSSWRQPVSPERASLWAWWTRKGTSRITKWR
jgi:tRNA splicing endonuclease